MQSSATGNTHSRINGTKSTLNCNESPLNEDPVIHPGMYVKEATTTTTTIKKIGENRYNREQRGIFLSAIFSRTIIIQSQMQTHVIHFHIE